MKRIKNNWFIIIASICFLVEMCSCGSPSKIISSRKATYVVEKIYDSGDRIDLRDIKTQGLYRRVKVKKNCNCSWAINKTFILTRNMTETPGEIVEYFDRKELRRILCR